jgi:uncharacterized protein (TIGR00266 family)
MLSWYKKMVQVTFAGRGARCTRPANAIRNCGQSIKIPANGCYRDRKSPTKSVDALTETLQERRMEHKIHGTTLQTLELFLDTGETVYSQTHQMAWMTEDMGMDTNTGGGILKGLMRSFSGASMFLTQFTPHFAPGMVAFCPRFPGNIIARQLKPGESLICRKESFLVAEASVHLDIFFRQQLGRGIFGGEGFILQKVTGPGWVFLDLSGEVVQKELRAGEVLQVHVGHVGVQDPSVEFGIRMLKGFKNVIFGGEGLFVATLTGPGRIYLQSMPIINLAEEIFRHLPHEPAHTKETPGGIVGDIIGGMLGGNE